MSTMRHKHTSRREESQQRRGKTGDVRADSADRLRTTPRSCDDCSTRAAGVWEAAPLRPRAAVGAGAAAAAAAIASSSSSAAASASALSPEASSLSIATTSRSRPLRRLDVRGGEIRTGDTSAASAMDAEAAAGLLAPHARQVVRSFRLSSVQLPHTQLAVAAVAAASFGAMRSSLAAAAAASAASDRKVRQTAQRCASGSLLSVQAAHDQRAGAGVAAAADESAATMGVKESMDSAGGERNAAWREAERLQSDTTVQKRCRAAGGFVARWDAMCDRPRAQSRRERAEPSRAEAAACSSDLAVADPRHDAPCTPTRMHAPMPRHATIGAPCHSTDEEDATTGGRSHPPDSSFASDSALQTRRTRHSTR